MRKEEKAKFYKCMKRSPDQSYIEINFKSLYDVYDKVHNITFYMITPYVISNSVSNIDKYTVYLLRLIKAFLSRIYKSRLVYNNHILNAKQMDCC